MLGNYLQQTTSADGDFRCIFFLGALRFKEGSCNSASIEQLLLTHIKRIKCTCISRMVVTTVLPAKSDSGVMFCLQSYQDYESIEHLYIIPIRIYT